MLVAEERVDIWTSDVWEPDRIALVRDRLAVAQLGETDSFVRKVVTEGVIVWRLILFNVLLEAPTHTLVLSISLVEWSRNVVIKLCLIGVFHNLVVRYQECATCVLLELAQAHIVCTDLICDVGLCAYDAQVG